MFCIVCTLFLYCFVYVYLFLFVLSVLVKGLLPPSENSITVSNDDNYNDNDDDNMLFSAAPTSPFKSGVIVP